MSCEGIKINYYYKSPLNTFNIHKFKQNINI